MVLGSVLGDVVFLAGVGYGFAEASERLHLLGVDADLLFHGERAGYKSDHRDGSR